MKQRVIQFSFPKKASWIVVAFLAGVATALGQSGGMKSKWDFGLPTVELTNVHVQSDSLAKAWQEEISSRLGIRSAPYLIKDESGKFVFDAEKCTVRDVLEAFTAAYPDYTYTQDENTGIIWIHPKAVAYENILPTKIKVAKGAIAVPMVTGVLDKLCQFQSLGIQSDVREGTFGLGTYDYPVDLPEGVHPVRDIINACCVANPAVSFALATMSDAVHVITRVMGSLGEHRAPPTALAYWQSEVGSSTQVPPTESELIDALSSRDVRIRAASQNYVAMCWPVMSEERLVDHAPVNEKGLWVAIGMMTIKARAPGTGLPAGVNKVRQVLNDESAKSISPELKALAVMEVARLAGYRLVTAEWLRAMGHPRSEGAILQATADITALERVTKWPLSAGDIANVQHDMIRVLRYSKHVRDKLIEQKVQWPGFSQADIEALGKTNIFSLP